MELGIEADLMMGPGRRQSLGVTSQKSPHVVLDSVNLVVPLIGNRRTVVPLVAAGIGETTIMRTSFSIHSAHADSNS